MIQFVGIHDPTTRRMLESILAKEEEHAEELRSMLEDVAAVLGNHAPSKNGDNK
jgi:bacterioferritin